MKECCHCPGDQSKPEVERLRFNFTASFRLNFSVGGVNKIQSSAGDVTSHCLKLSLYTLMYIGHLSPIHNIPICYWLLSYKN